MFAEREYLPGETILTMAGVLRYEPTRYSVQIDRFRHMELESSKISKQDRGYAWRYLNHSCDPNIIVRGLEVIAFKPIASGDELRFNYNATEWEMARPFQCQCGNCKNRWVQGFKFLTTNERKMLYPLLAAYLKSSVDEAID